MIHNVWANVWETALRSAIGDEAMLLAGHNDLAAGGIAHLSLTHGQVAAMATARHSRQEEHTVITLPALTGKQAAAVLTASPHCGHHRELRAGGLPDCLADTTHTGDVAMAPVAADIGFACTCGTSPCRHAAALVHAVTRRLSTHPAELAVVRGLSLRSTSELEAPSAATSAGTTIPSASGGKLYVTAHHAWGWHRECADPPSVPDRAPGITESSVPPTPSWPAPPSPAPAGDRLASLLNDAAAQARNHLLAGAALQCAWDDDAIRLASTVPRAAIPEIAHRLGLDIGQLRERLATQV